MRLFASRHPLLWGPVLLALCVPAAAGDYVPVVIAEYVPAGDGSGTDNPDLLRPDYTDCNNCMVLGEPRDWDAPFFDVDWSVALRGGYAIGTSGNTVSGSVLPRVLLTHKTLRTNFSAEASAEITQSTISPLRIATGQVVLNGDYELDAVTRLTSVANLSVSQDAPNLPAIEASPQIITGSVEGGVVRQFGRFDISGRVNAGRTVYGPTTLAGGVLQDNSWENNTAVGGGLRVAYPITPVLAAFADGSAQYQYFDAASPTLLAKLDGPTYVAKVGLAYDPSSILSAEASIGYGVRRFDAGFADVTATLYNARVTFRPDETLTLNGAFTTELTAPASTDSGLVRVKYTAAADGQYMINPWLGLRALADWYYADVQGNADFETGYDLGVGADYLLNRNTRLTADYGFAHVEYSPPTAPKDTHKFQVGVTFSR